VIAMAKSVNDIDAEKEIKDAFDVFGKDAKGKNNKNGNKNSNEFT
jgi:Ca2+-binding EF-hand superfamily protein